MFVVPGNLWESQCRELDPMHFVLLETYVSLLLLWAWWHGVALHLFSLSLAVTRNIYNSLESVPCYAVGVCVRTPKPNGKSQILARWGKKRSSTDILNAFIENVNPHTEVQDLKPILTVLWGFPLRCRSLARWDDIKQLRILGEWTALC